MPTHGQKCLVLYKENGLMDYVLVLYKGDGSTRWIV